MKKFAAFFAELLLTHSCMCNYPLGTVGIVKQFVLRSDGLFALVTDKDGNLPPCLVEVVSMQQLRFTSNE